MKRGYLNGSYTVEASFIMSLILFVMLTLIQSAYRLRDETVSVMVLQEMTEIIRHDEENLGMAEYKGIAAKKAGHMFSFSEVKFDFQPVLSRVNSSVKGGDWGMELQMGKFLPEEFMRMMTLAEE